MFTKKSHTGFIFDEYPHLKSSLFFFKIILICIVDVTCNKNQSFMNASNPTYLHHYLLFNAFKYPSFLFLPLNHFK